VVAQKFGAIFKKNKPRCLGGLYGGGGVGKGMQG